MAKPAPQPAAPVKAAPAPAPPSTAAEPETLAVIGVRRTAKGFRIWHGNVPVASLTADPLEPQPLDLTSGRLLGVMKQLVRAAATSPVKP